MNNNYNLDKIISPVSVSEFYDKYFQKKPFVVLRNDHQYFRDLLSPEDILRYFYRSDLSYPLIRMIKADGDPHPDAYCGNSNLKDHSSRVINNTAAFELFEQGNSFIISALEFYFDSLRHCIRSLSSEFKSIVGTSSFYTPPNSRSFNAHFDQFDNFIIQVSCTKIWRVYNCPIPFATFATDCPAPDELLDFEVELHAGDTLYFPRGFIHEVRTTDNPSFHITVTFSPFMFGDVFKHISQNMNDILGFRSPISLDLMYKPFFKSQLLQSFSDLIDECGVEDIRDHFQSKLDLFLQRTDTEYLNTVRKSLNL